ncbi:aldo/keto reductase [Amycolatopsis sp. GM8]|uniref:aldo/keto reductase n=1 Tax=Amycolatopsis sp. GM8 TaxID=2896530 RepID=UPI001F3EBB2E|nr:aldo/keto reductase [Amycolatopsis sp. GM8]
MDLPLRPLGSQGLAVSPQALGTLSISEFYGSELSDPPDVEEGIETIHRALELGVQFFDTADIYGNGHNEQVLGRALGPVRDQVIIATKFGAIRKAGATSHAFDGRPEYVRSSCESSLRRLGTDHIDLYYQHRADSRVPIEDTVGAMAELVQSGKVRYLGLSEASGDTLRRAHATHPISALQSEYSLFSRDIEADVLPACRALGIGLVAYSPLARGLLTGTITTETTFSGTDWRRTTHPRFSTENLSRNLERVAEVTAIAGRRGVTPAQVALAWLHHQGNDVIPVPGTKRQRYLEKNVAAFGIALDESELAILDQLVPVGDRYPDMSTVNRDTPGTLIDCGE